MLKLHSLTKKYGNYTVVNNLSFEAEIGEVIGLLGLNGAGKSTTMNMITGYSTATSGDITFDGISVLNDSLQVRQKIGYLPEIPPLYQDFTTTEHLRFICEARGIEKNNVSMEIERVCELANIIQVKNKLIRNLSKGYKQRIGIASALIGNPKLIILDEPTVGLDPMQLIEIRNLICELANEHIIIVSSHILSEVFSICTRLLVLRQGNLVSDLSKNDYLSHCSKYDSITVQVLDTVNDYTSIFLSYDQVETCIRIENNSAISQYEITSKNKNEPNTVLFDILAENHIPTFAIIPQKGTLEDIFMKLASF